LRKKPLGYVDSVKSRIENAVAIWSAKNAGDHGQLPERSTRIVAAHEAELVPVHDGIHLRNQIGVLKRASHRRVNEMRVMLRLWKGHSGSR